MTEELAYACMALTGVVSFFVGAIVGACRMWQALRPKESTEEPPFNPAKPEEYVFRAGQMVYGRYNSVTGKWELVTDPEDEAT